MTTTYKTERRSLAGVAAGAETALAPKSRAWLWVLLAFVVQISVWTAWIVIASHNKVQEVPLATSEVKR